MSDDTPLHQTIRRKALELEFDRVGFCDATPPGQASLLDRWLDAGMHATMTWIETGRRKRLDPQLVLQDARSMIVVAMAYASPGSPPPHASDDVDRGAPRGVISRYAAGEDYHRVLGDRLLELEAFIESSAPGHRALAYVDTGPLLERLWAAQAGIGWVGKNAMILNKQMGSFFFLGVIVTTLALPPDEPALDQCGACSLCLEACPTGAIVEPRLVDSRRCLSYHTIELRGELPEEYRVALGDRVFGCDDCQDVCPWNRHESAPEPPESRHFPSRPGSTAPSLLELLTMTHRQYQERFRGSAVKRATWHGLRRNAAAAIANVPADGETLGMLEQVAGDSSEEPIVREQAAWSADRIRKRENRS